MSDVKYFKLSTIPAYREAGWSLTPHGWLAWLHRFLWWVLGKLNARGEVLEETFEIVRLPCGDSIYQALLEQREGLFEVYRKPKEILIGPGTLSEMMGEPALRDVMMPMSVNARAGWNREIYGLPIRIVPQMEGVIILD